MPYNNERDIEIFRLLGFFHLRSDEIETILDVGCYGSQYLSHLKERGKIVDGIDIFQGEIEKKILRNYFVGNAIDYPLEKYDLVIALSTIEHAGIEQYEVDDYLTEQLNLFKKVIDISKKYAFVTVPFGTSAFHEGHLANLTGERLNSFLEQLGDAGCRLSFYFNDKPQSGFGWAEISREMAEKVPYDRTKGVRCVCILEIEKNLKL